MIRPTFQISKMEAIRAERDYLFFIRTKSNMFNSYLFHSLLAAKYEDFLKLAAVFPYHAYHIAKNHKEHLVKHFKLI